MGGFGTRAGAGETQIEVDRRIIRKKISLLKKKLKSIDSERQVQSKKRKSFFRTSFVGYTNVGKSSLMKSDFIKDDFPTFVYPCLLYTSPSPRDS